tara:strand:- start:302 stop:1315 length:1014 start_codon:yes stop_codon:yes gene_type:complete
MSKGTRAEKIFDYTIAQLKNLFRNDTSATGIDNTIDKLIANPNVKNSNSQIIAAGNAARKALEGPTPVLKAERTLDRKVTDRLKAQEAETRAAAPTGSKKPKPPVDVTKPTKDKPRPVKKETPLVANAGGNLTGANRKAIKEAPTPQALTSLQSKLSKEITKLKNITPAQEKARRIALADAISVRKQALRKAAETKPRRADTRPAPKKPQGSQERQNKAIGNTPTPRSSPQNDKKPGIGGMTSYTSMSRGDAIAKAGRDLRANRITKSEHEKIIKAIARKNSAEVNKASVRTSQKNRDRAEFKGYTPSSPFSMGGMPSKRTGNIDMRKGGMFKTKGN